MRVGSNLATNLRLAAALGAISMSLLLALEARSETKGAKSNATVPQKQKFLNLDIAQARLDAGQFWIKDSQGQRWPLCVDVPLQRSARRNLALSHPESGALVAIEVRTGKILVMSEWPPPASNDRSLLLRQLPAASLFKLVTSAALIEQARIMPDRIVCTSGGTHRVEEENLLPPQSGTAECGPFAEALGYSRNAVFAQLAHRYLQPEDLENFADRFGFGSPLPLEIHVPMGEFATDVEPLSFARAATGFVGSTLTPVGAAYIAYVIANRGRAEPLQLLDEPERTVSVGMQTVAAIQPETADRLHRMMEMTVRKGTSWRAFHDERGRPYLPHVSVAGKTGTLSEKEATFSWFVGFAPSQQPEIAFSIVLQNGPVWHRKANEIAREWLREYFARQRANSLAGRRTRRATSEIYASASKRNP